MPKKNEFVSKNVITGPEDDPINVNAQGETDLQQAGDQRAKKHSRHEKENKTGKRRIPKEELNTKVAKWRTDLKSMFPVTNFQHTAKKMALHLHEAKSHSDFT